MKTNNEKTNSTATKKAIAWVRCSTDKQHTVGEQLKAITKLAAADGYTAADLIPIGREGASAIKVDSAYKADLNTMYELMNSGEIGCIYAWAVDRIGRDQKENTFFKYKLLDCGIDFKTVEGVTLNAGDDGITSILLDLKQRIAEDEMRKKAMRFKLGKDRLRAAGIYVGGKVMFGYVLNAEKKYEINEEQAAVIRRIYNQHNNEGYSARRIARELLAEGIINHAHELSAEAFVVKMLRQKRYTQPDVNGQIIVSAEQQTIADTLLSQRQKKPRQTYASVAYFGQRLLKYNGYCMKVRKGDCAYVEKGAAMNLDTADSLIVAVCEYLRRWYDVNPIDTDTMQADLDAANNAIVNLQARKEKAAKSLKNALKLAVVGGLGEEEIAEISRANKQAVAEIEQQIAAYSDKVASLTERIKAIKTHAAQSLYSMTADEQKAEINKILNEITVEKVKDGTYTLTFVPKDMMECKLVKIDGTRTMTERKEPMLKYRLHTKAHKADVWNGTDWQTFDFKCMLRVKPQRAQRQSKRHEAVAA